jgi:hypothetical protein
VSGPGTPDYEAPCQECLEQAGFDYVLPLEDVAGGPITYPSVEGDLVGEATVAPGFLETPMGRMPVLRFIFTGPGPEPMSRRSLRPVNLLLDPKGLRNFRQLVSAGVDRAIVAARHGR